MNEFKITSQTLRKYCKKQEKENCFVCGKHSAITHSHHILPLKECAKWLNLGVENVPIPTISLCPNCHTYMHQIMNKYDYHGAMSSMNEEEYKRLLEILKIRQEIEDNLYHQFMEMYGNEAQA